MDALLRPIDFDSAAQALLGSCHLPTSDLSASSKALLFGQMVGPPLTGMVGAEIHGSDSLLRSLAVAESRRCSGLGAVLVSFAEQQAAARGAQAMYLLTTTAADFFERRGYSYGARKDAPEAIASSTVFGAVSVVVCFHGQTA